jgi:hypothetical protein
MLKNSSPNLQRFRVHQAEAEVIRGHFGGSAQMWQEVDRCATIRHRPHPPFPGLSNSLHISGQVTVIRP